MSFIEHNSKAAALPGISRQYVALDAGQIAAHLGKAAARNWQIRVATRLESSNSALMQEIRQHPTRIFSKPILLAAEEQTAGRGRQGRVWHSAPGASLTFSLAWPMRRTLTQLSGLSLICGLAVRAALLQQGLAVQLKWPNDILFNQRKLAGILIEVQEIKQGVMLVIGIGLNISPGAYPPAGSLDHLSATDLLTAGMRPPIDRNLLLAELARAIGEHLLHFEQHGFAAVAAAWNAAHAYQDCPVQLLDQGQPALEGIARGVDQDGRLLLETSTGLLRVSAGDVSLRPAGNPDPG